MRRSKKQNFDPIELIARFWPDASTDHITYDPKLKHGDFYLIKRTTEYAVKLVTFDLLSEALFGIVTGTTFHKGSEPEWPNVRCIRYTVGPMRHTLKYGTVKATRKDGKSNPPWAERICMAVQCEYILREGGPA